MTITDSELRQLERNIDYLDPLHKQRVLELLEERDRLARLTDGRQHFLSFVKQMWPDFIAGAHHTIMAEAFEKVLSGELKRLIINMPPRFTKSEFASVYLPAWFLGNFPRRKIIQVSNTENLAAGFGRRVRNMLSGQPDENGNNPYGELFPGVSLAKDSQAAAGWHTNHGGEYFAIGVNGKVTGKGFDIGIVDDIHSEQEAKQAESSPEIFDAAYEYYTSGIRQRAQPGAALVIVMTRWSLRDLTGQLLKRMKADEASGARKGTYDNWEVINLPAILDENLPTERSMWPGFWPLEELQRTRNAIPVPKWQAQYMQSPTSDVAAIIKRDSWRIWGKDTDADQKLKKSSCPSPLYAKAWRDLAPPACTYEIHSWDCAATKNDRSHPSAFTHWGVFEIEQEVYDAETETTRRVTLNNIILLSSYKARMEFPELKRKVKEFYDEDKPDTLLIENKSAGMQLLQEFRSMGIPAEDFSGSSRGSKAMPNDKVARANLVSDIFASGYVWAPENRSSEEVIEQCASFPSGDEDDLVDSTVQAMLRFRAGGFIRTANDEAEDQAPRARRTRYY